MPAKQSLLSLWPPWTAEKKQTSGFYDLSKNCRKCLLDMVHLFHAIDVGILGILRIDPEYYKPKVTINDHGAANITSGNPEIVKFEESALKPVTGTVLEAVSDTTHNTVWLLAIEVLSKYQGQTYHERSHTSQHSIATSLSILTFRTEIADAFAEIEEEFGDMDLGFVCGGVNARLLSLEGFTTIYRRDAGDPPLRVNKYRKNDPRGFQVIGEQQQQCSTTLIAITFCGTLLSFIPIIFAWHRATDTSGTVEDVDFYLLIQNSALQWLGLFTAMFPIYKRSSQQAWLWARIFTLVGILCSIASIPLYILVPTMWSALVSFFGSAAQAGMAMLLAQMADEVHLPDSKKKEK